MHFLPEYPTKIALSGLLAAISMAMMASSVSSSSLWFSNKVVQMDRFSVLFQVQLIANPRYFCAATGSTLFGSASIGELIGSGACDSLASPLPGTASGTFNINLGGGATIDAVTGAKDIQRGSLGAVVLLSIGIILACAFLALAAALYWHAGELEKPHLLWAYKVAAALQWVGPFLTIWVYLGAYNAAKTAWSYSSSGGPGSLIDLSGLTTGFYVVVAASVFGILAFLMAMVVWRDEVVIGKLPVGGIVVPTALHSSIPGVPTSPFFHSAPAKYHASHQHSGNGPTAASVGVEIEAAAAAAGATDLDARTPVKRGVTFSSALTPSPSSSSTTSATATATTGAATRSSQTSDALKSSLAVYGPSGKVKARTLV